MPYLVDSNILLRSIEEDHPMNADAKNAVSHLTAQKESLYLLPQNLREFWNVCTRPKERNGLGMEHDEVDAAIQKLETTFTVLEDGLLVYREWRQIVLSHRVTGVQVHDAYLVAAMRVHELTHVMTFNTGDFARYADLGIVAVHPAAVSP